jgi:hypothetical protein
MRSDILQTHEDVYTRRCPAQDSFYRTSSSNLPTLTLILAVRVSKHRCASSLYALRAQTHILAIRKLLHTCLSCNFPILTQYSSQQESVAKNARASTLSNFQTRTPTVDWLHRPLPDVPCSLTDYKSIDLRRQQSHDDRNVSVSIVT